MVVSHKIRGSARRPLSQEKKVEAWLEEHLGRSRRQTFGNRGEGGSDVELAHWMSPYCIQEQNQRLT